MTQICESCKLSVNVLLRVRSWNVSLCRHCYEDRRKQELWLLKEVESIGRTVEDRR